MFKYSESHIKCSYEVKSGLKCGNVVKRVVKFSDGVESRLKCSNVVERVLNCSDGVENGLIGVQTSKVENGLVFKCIPKWCSFQMQSKVI